MRRVAALLAVALAVLAGCGGGSGGRFDDDVAAVREAVEAGDAGAAEHALQTLSVDALAAHEEGDIDDAQLQEVAALVEASRAELAQVLPTSTTTTTTTTIVTATTPAPPPPDDEEDDDDEKEGKGEGKGKGDKDD